ncbi:MAG: hypothetical protein CR972_00765 [Candidatus Moraniibacteriota bacterium]|nr:MAG: hypothetical protein CR972_00765 [Candidatus Moranbacteria bacterium]
MNKLKMSQKKELSSIVITCHNYGRFLGECINSTLAQTYPVKEIIVINDASDDDSESVAKSFGDKIQYFAVDFCNGQKTRNFGLQKACGKYILFLDADDYLREDCIEEMQEEMEKDEELYIVYSGRYNVGNKNIMKKCGLSNEEKSLDYNYNILKYLNFISITSLIRRDKFEGFDESMQRYQDWDAWLTLLDGGKKAKRIAKPLFFARFHGKNLTVRTNQWKMLYLFHVKRHGYIGGIISLFLSAVYGKKFG